VDTAGDRVLREGKSHRHDGDFISPITIHRYVDTPIRMYGRGRAGGQNRDSCRQSVLK
jgi:hypothetical protein